MNIITTWLLVAIAGSTWRETISTCVLESDFGFTLNCAFKKSGLFRVRNLGGVGGYFGLGLTVGDELGFRNSISNLEASKRRSVQAGRGNFIAIGNGGNGVARRDSIPPFKPLPPGGSRPMAPQPERQRLVVQQNSTALRTVPAPSLTSMHEASMKQQQQMAIQQQQQKLATQSQYEAKIRQQQRVQQEALAIKMLKEQRQQQQEAMIRQKVAQQQSTNQQTLDLQTKRVQVSQSMAINDNGGPYRHTLPTIVAAIPPAESIVNVKKVTQSKPMAGVLVSENGLPAFIAMPQSSAQLTDRISNSPTLLEDSVNEVSKDDSPHPSLPNEQMAQSVNEMTLQSFNSANALGQNSDRVPSAPSLPSLGPIQGMGPSLKALAEASNITLEALEAAILLRQAQLMEKHQGPTTTTTTTTTQSPVKSYTNSGTTKVMNAPREYYPINYDKNFDDNFASRVDLPDTSFYCGDQKHFPGLYADEDLGCMVFHVCALTDDGLIMKSFLCPESTLFDQTILKCNWWFYVDCKSSRNLYDSNIPISKSYQLMKALAFFSAYKNHDNATMTSSDDQ